MKHYFLIFAFLLGCFIGGFIMYQKPESLMVYVLKNDKHIINCKIPLKISKGGFKVPLMNDYAILWEKVASLSPMEKIDVDDLFYYNSNEHGYTKKGY